MSEQRKPINLGEPKDVERKAREATQKLEQDQKDLREILDMPSGRRFIWRYLAYTGPFRMSAEASGSFTYLNEGRRSVGTKLLEEILAAKPEAYIQMLKENDPKGDLKNV